jgi:hypothetical protein
MSAAGRLARIVSAVVAMSWMFLVAPPADAQVTGGCSATIAGQDVATAHNARNAITVGADDTIVVTGIAPGPITGYKVFLTFGPTRVQVADGVVSDGGNTWTSTVDVADYATFGVGLYRIEGETTGTPCTGWAYVKVTGRFPLFTVAGAVGGVLAAAGAVGMALSRPRAAKTARTGVA